MRSQHIFVGLLSCMHMLACSGQNTAQAPRGTPAQGAAHAHVASDGGLGSDGFGNTDASSAASNAGLGGRAAIRGDAMAMDCGRQDFDVARRPADILLVLDRSGSMQDDVNGNSNKPSKWDLVVPALQEVITATDASVNWGLKLFPEGMKAGECTTASYPKDIAIEVGPNRAAAVNQAISAATPEGDGTPTGDAVDEAVKYLKGLSDPNPKYILLATDGEPSCTGTTKGSSTARPAAVSAVMNAADAGFHTFVVGIATTKSSAQTTLTDLAKAGREQPASMGDYLATTKDQLVSALQTIAGSVATCSFPLASKPPNPDHVGVFVGSQVIAKDTSDQDGWDYSDSALSSIQLFGPACEALMQSGAGSVKVVFGCKADPVF